MLILAGDQDPVDPQRVRSTSPTVCIEAGCTDVRTRVYPGVRHEVHNEPTTREDVVQEIPRLRRSRDGRAAAAGPTDGERAELPLCHQVGPTASSSSARSRFDIAKPSGRLT